MNKLRGFFKKKMTRENMIVLALSGILLMVIALPVGNKKKTESVSESGLSDTESGIMSTEETQKPMEEEALEQKLAEFLSCMEGAGQVKVMLNFSSTSEQIVEKDTPINSADTQENDANGGSRSITQQERGEETVYVTDRSGNQIPYVRKTLAARIEGVTVLAQGGDQPVVQKDITDALEALFGLEAHKIKVAKLK